MANQSEKKLNNFLFNFEFSKNFILINFIEPFTNKDKGKVMSMLKQITHKN